MQVFRIKLNRQFTTALLLLSVVVLFGVNLLFTFISVQNSTVNVDTLSFHLIISGILYFIIILSFIQYFFFRETTYLFYALYILVNLCYFTFIFSSHPDISARFPNWFKVVRYNLSLPLLCASYAVYVLFAIGFLNLKAKDSFVYKKVLLSARLYVVIFFISLILYFIPADNHIGNIIRTILLLSCMPLGIVTILLVYIRIKNNIARILCIGSLCFFTGSVFGFLFSSNLLSYPSATVPFNQWVFYTEMGTLLEIILFTSSFAYRNKVLAEEERKAQEILLKEMAENKLKEQKLQLIRNEIARDLHDDIGASLSNINILNELAKRNASNPGKANEYLEKASEDIQHVSESLNDIVWNINPKYDDPENLFVRMKRYAADMMDGKNISYEMQFPTESGIVKLNMDRRRDVYLIFKEAVNNLVKYSQASSASILLETNDKELRLFIEDNGIGFNRTAIKDGNGLDNMQQRAANWGAALTIAGKPGAGTKVELIMPLM
jgi:signal transduction histidine kinase